ncbi:glycine betaine ABC transporter substrate-binding protein [Thiorhodovibrio frisius]|uniref:ABC-type proline/glycine betaine transport system, periplasmic component n=1 Tax=Thiorhodovibrio frisius TaxID=631362 RepID=H8YZV8_9GAMM|nr:glycine betaine ABC transporter substrate-binding protein [Thiorhodovibrio frisius]EIC22235.1 ABC-type proline/glycine betaine transport system, periplasmic component [Thiorhodovibrio frisius]WPL24530.1 Glycine betaine/carnitine transport binding protein GbuC precursor [Thiorhodovibrio frisius]
MMKNTLKVVLALALTAGLSAGALAKDTIKIGWTAWSDAEFVTKLAAKILEDRMGYDVELIQTDIAPQYQGVANGDIDVMLMSWQPGTHADYVEKVCNDVVPLGILYTEAQLGWVVPNYIPEDELSSIEDLKKNEVKEKLDGTITGIDPGAGLTRLSKQAIEDYDLDYELQISSGAAMTAALKRAVDRNEWIVVTGWSPHWMFGAYDLRYLEDPKGVLGSYERVMAMARKGFYQDEIEAASFLSRMQIPLDDLQASMYDAQESSYEEAVDKYIENNGKRVDYWVTGEI